MAFNVNNHSINIYSEIEKISILNETEVTLLSEMK
jgi:hypothetical protein